ncbi:MAG: hypothetical protein K0S39_3983 [Paenibacillus sp.]|jgi:hypothetical protein|nr:hypothetical protein [Paenibacillus sp.]
MERLLLRILTVSSLAAVPFVFKRKNFLMYLTVFFAKGVLSTLLDSYFIKGKKIEYPIRPFSRFFDSNILYDLLFYPLLSVIWVRWTYNTKLYVTILRSLYFSVPMSIAQWALEKKTALFKWKSWSVLHTFISINSTLFLIRGMVGLIRMFLQENKPTDTSISSLKETRKTSDLEHFFRLRRYPQSRVEVENIHHNPY